MNTALRVVVNTRWPRLSSGRRLFFDDLAADLRGLGFAVEEERWDEYARFDVAIVRSTDVAVDEALRQNPNLVIGLVKPEDHAAAHASDTRRADFIISGSLEERDYYLALNPNIFVLYHIEKDWGLLKRHEETREITLGYHGNKAHLEQFYPMLQTALDALAARYPLRLKVIYDVAELGPWTLGRPRNLPITEVQWRYETVARELLDTDIGLVTGLTPVPDRARRRVFRRLLGERDVHFGQAENDYLLRFKNNSNAGRAFVFMQLGIPVVADYTPECLQAIFHGSTGFLAHSAQAWYDGIERLVQSARLRQQVADAARATLAERYDRKRNVEELATYMSALAAQRRAGAPRRALPVATPDVDLPRSGPVTRLVQRARHIARRAR